MKHLDGYNGPEPPESIRVALAKRMSSPSTSYPVLRLVWSENVMEKIGNTWNDWDPGVAAEDRGRLSNILDVDGNPMPLARPIRTVTEVREVPRYSDHETPGWMLERWFPAAMFGSPEAWAQRVVPGTDVPRLGPFPHEGRYVEICGPFPEIPSLDFLYDFVSYHEQITEERMAQDVGTHIRLRVEQMQQAEEERRQKSIAESVLIMKDHASYANSTSLAAGRLRNAAAERIGYRSHIGN